MNTHSTFVIKLPTASGTYYEVKEGARGVWRCTLVTPTGVGRKALRTALCKSMSFASVRDYAFEVGSKVHRPVKVVGAPV